MLEMTMMVGSDVKIWAADGWIRNSNSDMGWPGQFPRLKCVDQRSCFISSAKNSFISSIYKSALQVLKCCQGILCQWWIHLELPSASPIGPISFLPYIDPVGPWPKANQLSKLQMGPISWAQDMSSILGRKYLFIAVIYLDVLQILKSCLSILCQ